MVGEVEIPLANPLILAIQIQSLIPIDEYLQFVFQHSLQLVETVSDVLEGRRVGCVDEFTVVIVVG